MNFSKYVVLFSAFITSLTIVETVDINWIPNKEGLFSQFLQLRTMIHISKDFPNATLVVPSFHTSHTNDSHLSLCTLFNLAASAVSCPRDLTVNASKCRRDSSIIRRANNQLRYSSRQLYYQKLNFSENICFKASLPYLGGETRRDAILRAVSFESPKLQLGSKEMELYTNLYKGHLLGDNINEDFTVVHWRRGDQLTSRCQQGKDKSVNCMNVSQLITAVKGFSASSTVYVATNENSWNDGDVELLHSSGLAIYNKSFIGYSQNSIVGLMVEASLMLDASTFIGWGVSIMNDVIEHERMLRHKSWCSAHEEVSYYPTWCWLQEQHIQAYSQKNPRHTRTKRDILLQVDERMQRLPLILSEFNISTMPAYISEIRRERDKIERELNPSELITFI